MRTEHERFTGRLRLHMADIIWGLATLGWQSRSGQGGMAPAHSRVPTRLDSSLRSGSDVSAWMFLVDVAGPSRRRRALAGCQCVHCWPRLGAT
jgi:hypothetical protein